MNGMQSAIIFICALVLVFMVVYLLRHRLTELNLEVFKGVVKFWGRASPERPSMSNTGNTPKASPCERPHMSLAVLKILQATLHKTEGHHVVLDTRTENYHAASTLYGQIHGDIIGTCFFESPDYGEHDLAEAVLAGSRFWRITTRSLCNAAAQENVEKRFGTYRSRARLVIISDETELSRIGGIFARCEDGSYLAFMALNNFRDAKRENLGLVFCGDLAEQMYRYYRSFVQRYS